MPKYNIFDEHVDNHLLEKHNVLLHQDKVLFETANIINDAMIKSKMTQKELATFLGVSKGYISRILSGTENISIKNLAKILYKLGYEVSIQVTEVEESPGNICWVDFTMKNSDVHIKSSVDESTSPWGNVTTG